MKRRYFASAVCLILLASCSVDARRLAEKFSSPAEEAFAQNYLRLLADGQVDSAFSVVHPAKRSDTLLPALREAGAPLKDARMDSPRIIGASATELVGTGTRQLFLTFEIPAADSTRRLVANVAMQSDSGRVYVLGCSVSPPKARER